MCHFGLSVCLRVILIILSLDFNYLNFRFLAEISYKLCHTTRDGARSDGRPRKCHYFLLSLILILLWFFLCRFFNILNYNTILLSFNY